MNLRGKNFKYMQAEGVCVCVHAHACVISRVRILNMGGWKWADCVCARAHVRACMCAGVDTDCCNLTV